MEIWRKRRHPQIPVRVLAGWVTIGIAAIFVLLLLDTDTAHAQPTHTCHDEVATIVAIKGEPTFGTAGDDVIVGTRYSDVIHGRGGNDLICGYGGNDRLNGGGGRDTVFGGPGKDKVSGGPGKDVLIGGGGRDVCRGKADKHRECGSRRTKDRAQACDVEAEGLYPILVVGSWCFNETGYNIAAVVWQDTVQDNYLALYYQTPAGEFVDLLHRHVPITGPGGEDPAFDIVGTMLLSGMTDLETTTLCREILRSGLGPRYFDSCQLDATPAAAVAGGLRRYLDGKPTQDFTLNDDANRAELESVVGAPGWRYIVEQQFDPFRFGQTPDEYDCGLWGDITLGCVVFFCGENASGRYWCPELVLVPERDGDGKWKLDGAYSSFEVGGLSSRDPRTGATHD